MAERKTGRSSADVLGDFEDESDGKAGTDSTEDQEEARTERITDRPTVLMYLPEELHAELDARYSELRAQARRKGVDFSKNEHFYPAVLSAGLEHVEEELGWE